MKLIKLTLLILLSFISLTYSQTYNFKFSEIPENLKKDVNSVILFDHLSVEIHSQNLMTIAVKKAVTVLNKMGDANRYVRVFYDKNIKIKNVSIIIYDSSGKEVKKVKSKELKDVSQFDGFSLYTDNRLLYYDHVPQNYPYTIYYEYEMETVNTGFIPSWEPVESYLTSIVSSSYQLKSVVDIKIRTKELNFEGYTIKKNKASDIELDYELINFEGIENEPYSPELENFTPKLFVGLYKFNLEGIKGEASSWKEFGKWQYEDLKNGNDFISESAKIEVNKLVENISDPIEKAKVIYNYVQHKTRYISVQVGIGGWMPIKAQEVHKLGYGDCKGLTNYTKTLLDAVGVKSHYSLIWSGSEKKSVDKDFFSMQGNHAILNLPNDKEDIWLECTSQKVPFGHLGSFTDDRDVLVITPEGGVIKHTKVYKKEENLQFTKGSYSIDNEGNINANIQLESYGVQYDTHLGYYDGKSPTDLDVAFKEYFGNINNIKFSKIEVFNNKEESKYVENLEFSASNYATNSGNQQLITVNAFNKNQHVPKRTKERKLPFEILRGFIDLDEVEITLPITSKVEYIPEKVMLDTKFGYYSMELEKINEHTYLYKRKLQIEEGKYPKEDYEFYRNFRKEIAKHDNSKIILNK
ncbi:MAG: DUF3857 domain-containing protein [Lutibacter sp.]|jgi:hypothetical protein